MSSCMPVTHKQYTEGYVSIYNSSPPLIIMHFALYNIMPQCNINCIMYYTHCIGFFRVGGWGGDRYSHLLFLYKTHMLREWALYCEEIEGYLVAKLRETRSNVQGQP